MIPLWLRELEQLFGWLWDASWQASVLALLVLAVQWLFRSKLPPRWNYLLWFVVIARLVLPALPESEWSLFRFAPSAPVEVSVTVMQPLFPSVITAPTDAGAISPAKTPSLHFSLYTLLTLVWLTGGVAFLIVTIRTNYRFARRVSRSPEVSDPVLTRWLRETQTQLRVSRTIRLVEDDIVQCPAIMGLFRPTLLLPHNARQRFTDEELRLIFLHELAHLKRGDVATQWLISGLQILHWFNPVLWFAFRRMRIDREPATDALVLSRAGAEQKERYGEMLLKQLEHFNQRHSLPPLVGILEDKAQFKHRFALIAKFTRGSYGWSLLGTILLVTLAPLGLTRGKTVANTKFAPETKEKQIAISAYFLSMDREMLRKLTSVSDDKFNAPAKDLLAELLEKNRGGEIGMLNKRDVHELTEIANTIQGIDFISTPKIVMRFGVKGRIAVSRPYYYPVQYETDPSGQLISKQFEQEDLGLTLDVMPRPTPSATTYDLKILIQRSDLVGFQTSDGRHGRSIDDLPKGRNSAPAQPVFNRRKIDTQLFGREGETILFRFHNNSKTANRILDKPKEFEFLLLTASAVTPEK